MEVVPINEAVAEAPGKNDIVHEGKLYKFRIEPCTHGGVHVMYTRTRKVSEIVPSFLKEIVEAQEPNRTVEEKFVEDHIHAKWWEKLIGRGVEFKVRKFIKVTRLEFKLRESPHFKKLLKALDE